MDHFLGILGPTTMMRSNGPKPTARRIPRDSEARVVHGPASQQVVQWECPPSPVAPGSTSRPMVMATRYQGLSRVNIQGRFSQDMNRYTWEISMGYFTIMVYPWISWIQSITFMVILPRMGPTTTEPQRGMATDFPLFHLGIPATCEVCWKQKASSDLELRVVQ